MKLMIEIPEEIVKAIQNGKDYRYDIHTAIAQGTPYEERPQGKWIFDYLGYLICSNCGYECLYNEEGCYSFGCYCHHCGAKMKEADND